MTVEKPAPTDCPIHDLLQRRWSPRAFDERPVEPDTLARLFEAAPVGEFVFSGMWGRRS